MQKYYASLFFLVLSLTVVWASDDDIKADSIVYDKPVEWRVYSAGAPVVAFAVQGDLLWMATEAGVVSQSFKNKQGFVKYPKLGAIPSTDVTCMATDARGSLWIGGKNGAAVLNGKDFTSYTVENGLADNNVNALATAGSDIWVGTDNGVSLYRGGTWKKFTVEDGLLSNKVQCILIDSKGAVWFGTNKGISVYNGATWTAHTMKKGMSWNDTKALAQDRKKGVVWAAVGEKDINSFDGKDWTTYMDVQESTTSIMVDTQSRMWFGSPAGIIKFNGDEWITDPKQVGLPITVANKMILDDGGNMWFAMESGVLRFANPYPY